MHIAKRCAPTPTFRLREPDELYLQNVGKEIRNMPDGCHAGEEQWCKCRTTTFDGDRASCFGQTTYAIPGEWLFRKQQDVTCSNRVVA